MLWNDTTGLCFGREDNTKERLKETAFKGLKWSQWPKMGPFDAQQSFCEPQEGGGGTRYDTIWKAAVEKTFGAALRSTWPLN